MYISPDIVKIIIKLRAMKRVELTVQTMEIKNKHIIFVQKSVWNTKEEFCENS